MQPAPIPATVVIRILRIGLSSDPARRTQAVSEAGDGKTAGKTPRSSDIRDDLGTLGRVGTAAEAR
jgi:hypothetical protein